MSSSPKAPDPYATAAAQGQMNADAARVQAKINRGDTYGPDGSVTNTEIAPDRWETRINLNEGQQRIYDNQTLLTGATSRAALDAANRTSTLLGQGLDTSGLPAWRSVDTGGIGPVRTSIGGAGQGVRGDFNLGAPMERVSGAGQGIIPGVQGAGEGIRNDFSGGAQLGRVGPADFSADRRRVEEGLLSRLEPQFGRDRADLEARLTAQGFTPGSTAYQNAADELNRARTDARFQAIGAGGAEQSRLFGLDVGRTGFNNAASGTEAAARNAALQAGNQAQQQGFGQNLAAAGFANDAQAQGFSQRAGQAGANNQALQAEITNINQGIGAQNEAQAQGFDQRARDAAFGNTAVGQQFNQAGALASAENQRRSAMLAEMLQLRAQPINEVSALFGLGNGVTPPQMQQLPGVQVAAPDYQGLVSGNYKAASGAAASNNAATASGVGAIAGAAASTYAGLAAAGIVV